MKMHYFLLIILTSLAAVSCESEDKEKTKLVRKFRSNRFDLTFNTKIKSGKLSVLLPEGFQLNPYTKLTLQSNGKTYFNSALGIHYTMESFSKEAIDMDFVQEFLEKNEDYLEIESEDFEENQILQMNLIHNAYVFKRYSTLTNGSISIKKTISKKVKFNGLIQVVSGQSDYGELLYYATASIRIKNSIWVFQFITTHEMMDYVYDDFEQLLESIRIKNDTFRTSK